jgi:hypothetical protein
VKRILYVAGGNAFPSTEVFHCAKSTFHSALHHFVLSFYQEVMIQYRNIGAFIAAPLQ